MDKSCSCLPTWMACLGVRACAQCKEPFQRDESLFCNSLFIPCVVKKDRIHGMLLQLHDRCIQDWNTVFESTNRHRICERFPLTLEHITPEALSVIRKNCFEKHKFLLGACGHCNTASQESCKLRECTRCRMARYCDVACQTADWSKHKRFCAKRSKAMKKADATTLRTDPVDETARCPCFTAYETMLFERSFTNKCSAADCDNLIPDNAPRPFSVYVGECLYYADKTHTIDTKYCSSDCQIKAK